MSRHSSLLLITASVCCLNSGAFAVEKLLNPSAWMSSQYNVNTRPEKCVDGQVGYGFDQYVCCSKFQESPVLNLDLRGSWIVTRIVIFNRNDCCPHRLLCADGDLQACKAGQNQFDCPANSVGKTCGLTLRGGTKDCSNTDSDCTLNPVLTNVDKMEDALKLTIDVPQKYRDTEMSHVQVIWPGTNRIISVNEVEVFGYKKTTTSTATTVTTPDHSSKIEELFGSVTKIQTYLDDEIADVSSDLATAKKSLGGQISDINDILVTQNNMIRKIQNDLEVQRKENIALVGLVEELVANYSKIFNASDDTDGADDMVNLGDSTCPETQCSSSTPSIETDDNGNMIINSCCGSVISQEGDCRASPCATHRELMKIKKRLGFK